MATKKKVQEDCERKWRMAYYDKDLQMLSNRRFYGTEKLAKKEGTKVKKELGANKVEYTDLGE